MILIPITKLTQENEELRKGLPEFARLKTSYDSLKQVKSIRSFYIYLSWEIIPWLHFTGPRGTEDFSGVMRAHQNATEGAHSSTAEIECDDVGIICSISA